ncbi:MAG: hypothetical protein ONB46_13155 [candidate division KSB1 bacterium]|nr:hypothetical protein [candidate division KSB1 bacterium]MDZ7366730.1 hypothetical protein [candidate division KSB1 bacterium]MDZ7404743.1 hypothetical protein [candidate division KSB1 bacterium]
MSKEKRQHQQSAQNLNPEEGLGSSETFEQSPLAFRDTISFFRAVITPPPHPLQDVVNAEHLSKWIEHEEKNEQRAFEDAKQLRKHTTWRLVIFSSLFHFRRCIHRLDKSGHTHPSSGGSCTIVSGVGAGLGVKSYLDRKKG